jgi:hypothetical protein
MHPLMIHMIGGFGAGQSYLYLGMSLPVLVWRDGSGAEAPSSDMVKLMPRRGYIPTVTQGLAASHPPLGYCPSGPDRWHCAES